MYGIGNVNICVTYAINNNFARFTKPNKFSEDMPKILN